MAKYEEYIISAFKNGYIKIINTDWLGTVAVEFVCVCMCFLTVL